MYTVIGVGGEYDGYEIGTFDRLDHAIVCMRDHDAEYPLGCVILDDDDDVVSV